MDTMEIVVILGGVALIGLTLWYFFGEREKVAAETNETGVQEIKVTVKGGYSPDLIEVVRGVPVRLMFDRQEARRRADETQREVERLREREKLENRKPAKGAEPPAAPQPGTGLIDDWMEGER